MTTPDPIDPIMVYVEEPPMELFLVQHGKSFTEADDPERSLTPEGIQEVEAVARQGKDLKVAPKAIFHSGKKRARQTAEVMAKVLRPKKGVQEIGGINPNDDVEDFAREFTHFDGAMVVGHLPFLEKLVSFLTGGKKKHPVFRFQNGGIVRLTLNDQDGLWTVSGALLPAPLGVDHSS